jgi:hypothetical protein
MNRTRSDKASAAINTLIGTFLLLLEIRQLASIGKRGVNCLVADAKRRRPSFA